MEAPQIAAGRLEDAVGGGVSQVATTLYNAAFFGGMELIDHTPHQFWISRYPEGREATVNYGSIDLRFRNDSPHGVLIQSFLAGGMPSFSAYPFLADGHPDKRPWTGGCGNAWWWHTEHDTLDKADVSILANDVTLGLAAVWGLAAGGVLPLDYRATARGLLIRGASRSAGPDL